MFYLWLNGLLHRPTYCWRGWSRPPARQAGQGINTTWGRAAKMNAIPVSQGWVICDMMHVKCHNCLNISPSLIIHFIITGRYGPLCRPTTSSCQGFLTRAVFALSNPKTYIFYNNINLPPSGAVCHPDSPDHVLGRSRGLLWHPLQVSTTWLGFV